MMEWSIEIIQNGKTVAENNNEIVINKLPFILKIKLSEDLKSKQIKLNALNDNTNFNLIVPGLSMTPWEDEKPIYHCFMGGKSMALSYLNEQKTLLLTKDSNHLIFDNSTKYERQISYIWDPEEKNATSIDVYHGQKLFLVFLLKFNLQTINENEIKKIIIRLSE